MLDFRLYGAWNLFPRALAYYSSPPGGYGEVMQQGWITRHHGCCYFPALEALESEFLFFRVSSGRSKRDI